jgi:hypothetical protein
MLALFGHSSAYPVILPVALLPHEYIATDSTHANKEERSWICVIPCRFHMVAYLSQIWWFEVKGEIEFFFPEGTYSLFYRVHLGRPFKRLGRRVYSSEHIHGWDIKPVRFQMSTSDGQHVQSKCYLTDPGIWINHHVGDFVVKDSSRPMNIRFAMIQIDCTHTKGGLCVDSVVVKPQYLTQKKAPWTYV